MSCKGRTPPTALGLGAYEKLYAEVDGEKYKRTPFMVMAIN
jgi:hypothetical protein